MLAAEGEVDRADMHREAAPFEETVHRRVAGAERMFEIEAQPFSVPLRNRLTRGAACSVEVLEL